MRRLAVLMLVSTAAALGQASSTISLSNGATLRIHTTFGKPEMAPASGNSFYRIFRDQSSLFVYAYELAVDRPAEGHEFRLTIKPAGDAFAAQFPNADGGKPTPTLSEPRQLPPLTSGKSASIDVFELPGTGEKVVDTVELEIDAGSKTAGGQLRFDGLKVSAGQKVISTAQAQAVGGRYVMFYLPGRGGYFFATEAPPGYAFVQAGSIDGAHLRFTMENEAFDCTADARILAGADSGEVWVYHDPHYRPQGNWTEPLDEPAAPRQEPQFFAAGANTLGWWIAPIKR